MFHFDKNICFVILFLHAFSPKNENESLPYNSSVNYNFFPQIIYLPLLCIQFLLYHPTGSREDDGEVTVKAIQMQTKCLKGCLWCKWSENALYSATDFVQWWSPKCIFAFTYKSLLKIKVKMELQYFNKWIKQLFWQITSILV